MYQIKTYNEAKATLKSTKESSNVVQTGCDSRDPTWHNAPTQQKLLNVPNAAVKSYKSAKDNIERCADMS